MSPGGQRRVDRLSSFRIHAMSKPYSLPVVLMRSLCLISILVVTPTSAAAEVAHPMVLWYEKPATEWVETLPVGNGRFGAMIFGGVARERIQFNDDTLWSDYAINPKRCIEL